MRQSLAYNSTGLCLVLSDNELESEHNLLLVLRGESTVVSAKRVSKISVFPFCPFLELPFIPFGSRPFGELTYCRWSRLSPRPATCPCSLLPRVIEGVVYHRFILTIIMRMTSPANPEATVRAWVRQMSN